MNKMSKRVLAMAMAATMITGSSAAVMASVNSLTQDTSLSTKKILIPGRQISNRKLQI